MKFTIIGSGGCVCTPKPLCHCKVCEEAREKGYPYARCGCSLILEDINLLIDTPEDIAHALNNAKVEAVEYILYSHLDPDHTLGLRIIEQLRLDWLEYSVGIKCKNPIKIMAIKNVLKDINAIRTKYGSIMDYYESMHLIKREKVREAIQIKDIKISFVPVNENEDVTIFVFEQKGKKLIYAPCDVKPFPRNEIFRNADYLIIGNTIVGNVLKNGFVLNEDNVLHNELFTLEEIENIKKQYNMKKVIITHIEEDWGKTYDDYMVLQKSYTDIQFAFDGLVIEL